MCLHSYVRVSLCVFTCKHFSPTNIHKCVRTHTLTRTCTCTHTRVCTRARTHTCIYTFDSSIEFSLHFRKSTFNLMLHAQSFMAGAAREGAATVAGGGGGGGGAVKEAGGAKEETGGGHP